MKSFLFFSYLVLIGLVCRAGLHAANEQAQETEGERAYLFSDNRLNGPREWSLNRAYQRLKHSKYVVIVEAVKQSPCEYYGFETTCNVVHVLKGEMADKTIMFRFVSDCYSISQPKDVNYKLILCFNEIKDGMVIEGNPDVFDFDSYIAAFEKVMADIRQEK